MHIYIYIYIYAYTHTHIHKRMQDAKMTLFCSLAGISRQDEERVQENSTCITPHVMHTSCVSWRFCFFLWSKSDEKTRRTVWLCYCAGRCMCARANLNMCLCASMLNIWICVYVQVCWKFEYACTCKYVENLNMRVHLALCTQVCKYWCDSTCNTCRLNHLYASKKWLFFVFCHACVCFCVYVWSCVFVMHLCGYMSISVYVHGYVRVGCIHIFM